MAQVALNGKFYGANPTAVHRVAAELIAALDKVRAASLRPGVAMEIIHPPAASPPAFQTIAARPAGRLMKKQPWEQIELPVAARGKLLVSLCNLAPVVHGRAVTMIHDAQAFTTPESYSRAFVLWYRSIYRLIGRRHRILTVSEFSRRELARHGVALAETVGVVPNGVDHVLRVAADPGALAKFGLVRHGYVLGLANTMVHKNVALLLKAFARPEAAGLKLVLFGSSTRADFAAAGAEAPSNVVFTGHVSDGELRALMEGALATATPSRTEGFGLPALEGMLLGTPAVIAPCGALPEVCGPAALTASPDDPAQWASEIARAQEFTWDRAARILQVEIAAALAAGRHPARAAARETVEARERA